jgi:hypothetical protein
MAVSVIHRGALYGDVTILSTDYEIIGIIFSSNL